MGQGLKSWGKRPKEGKTIKSHVLTAGEIMPVGGLDYTLE